MTFRPAPPAPAPILTWLRDLAVKNGHAPPPVTIVSITSKAWAPVRWLTRVRLPIDWPREFPLAFAPDPVIPVGIALPSYWRPARVPWTWAAVAMVIDEVPTMLLPRALAHLVELYRGDSLQRYEWLGDMAGWQAARERLFAELGVADPRVNGDPGSECLARLRRRHGV